MNRREFTAALAAPALLRSRSRGPARITRITLAPVQGRFHKFVAMNSYDVEPKGHTYMNTLVRVFTDAGMEGVGVAAGAPTDPKNLEALKALLGADALSLYEMREGRITGRSQPYADVLVRLKWLDGPLFDLVGKLTAKPCWKLLGEAARERVEAYDGTLYFSDVWFSDRGVRAVLEEAEESLKSGYLGMKFKIGRGWKWMEREAGLRRDIEVLKAVRKLAGPKVKILADANNGFRDDFERAWRLTAETAEAKLHWMEEIFPEDVALYTRLRELMAKAGIRTLVADGETVREPEALAPFLKPQRLVDVLQLDMRVGGFLGNLQMARLGEPAGAVTVPHNWASRVGLLMGLHMAKAVPSVVAAEDDRSSCDVLMADGYRFRQGHYSLPDSPGLGLVVDQKIYDAKCRSKEITLEIS